MEESKLTQAIIKKESKSSKLLTENEQQLLTAINEGRDTVSTLLESIKKIESPDILIAAVATGNARIIRALLKKSGVDINAANSAGDTPLHVAACNGLRNIVPMLLNEYGAIPWLKNKEGETALDVVGSVKKLLGEKGSQLLAETRGIILNKWREMSEAEDNIFKDVVLVTLIVQTNEPQLWQIVCAYFKEAPPLPTNSSNVAIPPHIPTTRRIVLFSIEQHPGQVPAITDAKRSVARPTIPVILPEDSGNAEDGEENMDGASLT